MASDSVEKRLESKISLRTHVQTEANDTGGNRNMKKLVRIAAIAAAALMAVSAAGCSSTRSLSDVKNSGKLMMSTNAEFEPFEYKDGGEIVGIDIDISKKIAESLGVELEISDIAFDSLIPALQSGKADIVAAGMTADKERRESVDFSDPYFNASQAIIVAADSDITGPADLADKTVGVQLGTTGDQYCTNEDGESEYTVAEVRRYSKGMEAVSDLMAGRIDAVVIDNFPAQKFVENNEGAIKVLDTALTEEEYAIAVPKGNTEMLDAVNSVLAEMKESGELDEIVAKYESALS